MPRLLTLLACEKAILDKQDVPTLVAVISGVKAQAIANSPEQIEPNALAPKQWTIFTIWDFDEEDIGKTFRQKSELVTPDGSIFGIMKADMPFVSKGGLNNNFIYILGFPIGVVGTWKVKLWLESEDGQKLVPEVFYPIKVEHGEAIPPDTQ